jgi:excinuclease ABC subunit A
VLYVLDEPSIGLHQRDNDRLLEDAARLRDLGNTVLVVEHDEDAIRDRRLPGRHGPGAGVHGGTCGRQGTPDEVMANPNSLTGAVPDRRPPDRDAGRAAPPTDKPPSCASSARRATT